MLRMLLYLCYFASLVEAAEATSWMASPLMQLADSAVGAAEVAVEVVGASDVRHNIHSLVESVFSSAARGCPNHDDKVFPKALSKHLRIQFYESENLLIRSLNLHLIGLHIYLLINILILIVLFFKSISI